MNKKIVEILGLLIQRMVNDDDIWTNQEEIIIELEDKGYTIENISEAYDILLEEDISIDDSGFYIDYEMMTSYNRVFTDIENFYFTNEIKAIIYKLNSLGIITVERFEMIIFRIIHLATVGDLKIDLVWDVINEVIDDPDILVTISSEIEEFKHKSIKPQRVN